MWPPDTVVVGGIEAPVLQLVPMLHVSAFALQSVRSVGCRSESASSSSSSPKVNNNGDNEAEQTESFSENEDENHADNHVFLGVGADCGVSDDANGEARGEGGESTAKAGAELLVSLEDGVGAIACSEVFRHSLLNITGEEDGDNKSVDTEDTSHNNGDDGLEEEFWLENDGTADADSRLGSAVGGTEVSEDEGGGETHVSEECALVAIVVYTEQRS